MNESSYNMLLLLLKDFAFIAAFALFFISLIVGLLLLLRPSFIIQLNHRVDKKFSLRRATKFIEVPYPVDHLFYKHHRILGVVVTLTSAYVLYYFLAIYDAEIIADFLQASSYAFVYDILINAGRLFMLICSSLIVLLGVTIFIRPSQLKIVEKWANHWVSTRKPAQLLSVEHHPVNRLAYNYPRLTGIIIIILSLYASIFLFLAYTR